jgi:hypothetical protein
MSGLFFNSPWTSVFYLELTGGPGTVTDLQSLADEVASLWNTNYAPLVAPSVTLSSVDVRYYPSVGSELRYTGTYAHAGTNAGTSIDDVSSCIVVDFVISDYYRGGHPRQYLPGPIVTDVTAGKQISAAKQSAVVAGVNTFRNGLNAFTTTNFTAVVMGTVRFASGNVWLSPPYFVAFTSVKIGKKGVLGSQRRRLLAT